MDILRIGAPRGARPATRSISPQRMSEPVDAYAAYLEWLRLDAVHAEALGLGAVQPESNEGSQSSTPTNSVARSPLNLHIA